MYQLGIKCDTMRRIFNHRIVNLCLKYCACAMLYASHSNLTKQALLADIVPQLVRERVGAVFGPPCKYSCP